MPFSRLAALKKNGEENWKKKVPKVEITNTTTTAPPPATTTSNNTSVTPKENTTTINMDNNGNDHDNGNIIDQPVDDEEETEASIVQLRRKKSGLDRPGGKVGSLQERLSQLENAQTSWQTKVAEKVRIQYAEYQSQCFTILKKIR